MIEVPHPSCTSHAHPICLAAAKITSHLEFDMWQGRVHKPETCFHILLHVLLTCQDTADGANGIYAEEDLGIVNTQQTFNNKLDIEILYTIMHLWAGFVHS